MYRNIFTRTPERPASLLGKKKLSPMELSQTQGLSPLKLENSFSQYSAPRHGANYLSGAFILDKTNIPSQSNPSNEYSRKPLYLRGLMPAASPSPSPIPPPHAPGVQVEESEFADIETIFGAFTADFLPPTTTYETFEPFVAFTSDPSKLESPGLDKDVSEKSVVSTRVACEIKEDTKETDDIMIFRPGRGRGLGCGRGHIHTCSLSSSKTNGLSGSTICNIISSLKSTDDYRGVLTFWEKEKSNRKLNDIHFSNMFTALAKGGKRRGKLLAKDARFLDLLQFVTARLRDNPTFFGVRELGNIIHAMGKLEVRNEPFLSAAVSQRRRIAEKGDTLTLSTVTWAFARMEFNVSELFREVAKEHARIAAESTIMDLFYLTRAYATVGQREPELFDSIAGEAVRIAQSSDVQSICSILWAFAKCRHRDSYLFDTVSSEAGRLATKGKPFDLSNLVWAYAKNGHNAPGLFAAIEGNIERIVREGKPRHLTSILCAFATSRCNGLRILRAVERQGKLWQKDHSSKDRKIIRSALSRIRGKNLTTSSQRKRPEKNLISA